MLKLKTSLIVNISQNLVIDKLMTFPERYEHHFSNSYKGIWQCKLLDIKKDTIIFQFIDKSFDFSKGIKTEAPLIVLKTEQNETKTTIQVSLQWIKLKIILLALSLVFLFHVVSFCYVRVLLVWLYCFFRCWDYVFIG